MVARCLYHIQDNNKTGVFGLAVSADVHVVCLPRVTSQYSETENRNMLAAWLNALHHYPSSVDYQLHNRSRKRRQTRSVDAKHVRTLPSKLPYYSHALPTVVARFPRAKTAAESRVHPTNSRPVLHKRMGASSSELRHAMQQTRYKQCCC